MNWDPYGVIDVYWDPDGVIDVHWDPDGTRGVTRTLPDLEV